MLHILSWWSLYESLAAEWKPWCRWITESLVRQDWNYSLFNRHTLKKRSAGSRWAHQRFWRRCGEHHDWLHNMTDLAVAQCFGGGISLEGLTELHVTADSTFWCSDLKLMQWVLGSSWCSTMPVMWLECKGSSWMTNALPLTGPLIPRTKTQPNWTPMGPHRYIQHCQVLLQTVQELADALIQVQEEISTPPDTIPWHIRSMPWLWECRVTWFTAIKFTQIQLLTVMF